MISGAERIKTIVQDLKKFARKTESSFDSNVSINDVAEQSVRLVRKQVERKANIILDLSGDLPPATVNSVGLQQVIVNLIMNANDAIGEGKKGNIRISTALGETKDYIVIKVSDDGSGMDKATMRRIFDPFFTTKRNLGGTGLGLSIAYRIVKEHHGEIEVQSEPGKGTTFTVEIPINAGHNESLRSNL